MQTTATAPGLSTASPAVNTQDGSLLLHVERGSIIGINNVATLIWSHLEQNSRGLTLTEIVNYVQQSCSESAVPRVELEHDVGELLGYLEKREVIQKRTHRNSASLYRTVDGVLRTHPSIIAATPRAFAREVDVVHQIKRLLTPVSKDPSLAIAVEEQVAEINRLQATTHTLVALLSFAAYDTLMKALGFHRLCRILRRSVFRKKQIDRTRILRVCAGVERARIWYPKEIKCLQHSAVITFLLGRCGLNARLAIGGRSMPFQSHAWVELDGIVINDTQKVQQYYKVFQTF